MRDVPPGLSSEVLKEDCCLDLALEAGGCVLGPGKQGLGGGMAREVHEADRSCRLQRKPPRAQQFQAPGVIGPQTA